MKVLTLGMGMAVVTEQDGERVGCERLKSPACCFLKLAKKK